jgi:hypothetical protein
VSSLRHSRHIPKARTPASGRITCQEGRPRTDFDFSPTTRR